MGQDISNSTAVTEDTPCHTLKDRSLSAVAEYILKHAKNIVVMVGAGVSTGAGIPDFRSPGTGLYANLARLRLPYAEAVFDISYFKTNPQPFYCLARELYPGKYKPTISHAFIYLLAKKGILLKLFSQNIDCLDRQAGVPPHKVVEAHGSFATQSCIECKSTYPKIEMQRCIISGTVPYCKSAGCNGLVKPDIVFFGEALPPSFHSARMLPREADLCMIIGTSLTVQPFASLPQICDGKVPRILINRERVGDLGAREDDVLILDECDTGIRRLAEALGWIDELEHTWSRITSDGDGRSSKSDARPKDFEQQIQDLVEEIDDTLSLSRDHMKALQVLSSADFEKRSL